MSDIGTIKALEAEIVAALTANPIEGVLTVKPTLSFNDLMIRDGIRKPAIGVIYLGSDYMEPYALGQRRFRAVSRWQVAVCVNSLRDSSDARAAVYDILDAVRDKVHFLFTSQSYKGAFKFEREEIPLDQPEGSVLGVATFSLELFLGK